MDTTDLCDTSILVTGATGFIGQHLVHRLRAAGAQVTGLTSSQAGRRRLPHGISGYVADLRDASAVRAALQAVHADLVFHLAAVGVTQFGIDPVTAVQVNVEGTINLLTALKDTRYRRFIFAGTGHEYGDGQPPFREDQPPSPSNVYAASKSAAWLFCQMYHRLWGCPVVGVRPFGVYGPGQRPPAFLPTLILSALQGRDFSMTQGTQVRDLIYVEDVVAGMLHAATVPDIEGQIFNLCSGEGISLAELAQRVLTLMDDPIRVKLGALPYRPGQIWQLVGDNSQAGRVLGWQPTVSLDDGLRRTIAWCTEMVREA